MRLLYITLALAACASGMSTDQMKKLEEKFEDHFGKEYDSKKETLEHAKELADQMKEIKKQNQDPDGTFKMKPYSWSNTDDEEFGQKHGGAIKVDDGGLTIHQDGDVSIEEGEELSQEEDADSAEELDQDEIEVQDLDDEPTFRTGAFLHDWGVDEAAERILETYRNASNRALPRSYDSRKLGLISPVKNQGQCGSCAAFASTALIETCLAKSGAGVHDLGEQYMVDCLYDGQAAFGCDGADFSIYLRRIAQNNGGIGYDTSESLYPYKAVRGSCKLNSYVNPGKKVTESFSSYRITSNSEMKQLVYDYGAVVTGIVAENNIPMRNYRGGVINVQCPDPNAIDHAVLIVGWDVDAQGKEYWIIKNSWGSNWGENGYVKIRFGLCGVATVGVWAKCGDNYSPVGDKKKCDISNLFASYIKQNGDINGSNMSLTITSGGKTYKPSVSCSKNICSVQNQQGTYACQDICGKSGFSC